ncbi:MAG: flagellar basal body P-ring protein FlgI [Acidobacteriota bacterium]|nr:flagellar basal body P-ring protein FlgI [Acidobacteriota bacterium]
MKTRHGSSGSRCTGLVPVTFVLALGTALAAGTAVTPPGPPLKVERVAPTSDRSSQRGMVRLRDVVDVRGVRDNQLVGYGLVVGLAGTGDGTQAKFTIQSLANALQRMGVVVPPSSIRVRNAAAVMVTADLPAFARPGSRLDVTVSSIGDAKSLTGGTLLMTPLKGPDGRVYALAQGPISLGGAFAASGGGGSVQKNHPTTGLIPSGALVERTAGIDLAGRDSFELQLRSPDFETAFRIEKALNQAFDDSTAHAIDAGTVKVMIPDFLRDKPVEFLAHTLEIGVRPDVPARVVLNERTGTVVLGGNVMISQVSVTHGNLTIAVTERYGVSQPGPFSQGGETVVVPEGEVVVDEEPAQHLDLGPGTSVEELVKSLKKVGVTPRDMIAIFQAIRAAGALHAELVVI